MNYDRREIEREVKALEEKNQPSTSKITNSNIVKSLLRLFLVIVFFVIAVIVMAGRFQ